MSYKVEVEKQFPANQENVARVLLSYGVADFAFEKATSGIENATLIITTKDHKFVLRIYRVGKKTYEAIERELGFMQYLRADKIPVPNIILNSKKSSVTLTEISDTQWQSIAMEFVEGKHPTDYQPGLLSEMAQIQAHIHLLGIEFAKQFDGLTNHWPVLDCLSFVKDVDWSKISDSKLLDFKKRVGKFRVDLSHLPLGYSHYDFDIANIISDGTYVKAVLDFDDMLYTALVVCLGFTLYHILRRTKSVESTKEYLQRYQQYRQLEPDELSVLTQIMLSRHYVISCLKLIYDGHTSENAAEAIELEQTILNIQF